MKISLTLMIDDKTKVYEANAHMQTDGQGHVDPITVKWMTLGMLQDAIQNLRVVAMPKVEAPPPAQHEAPAEPDFPDLPSKGVSNGRAN